MYGSCTVLTGEWGYERRMREEEGGHECPRGAVLKFFRDEETGNSTPPNDHRTLFRLKKSRVGKESKKKTKKKDETTGLQKKKKSMPVAPCPPAAVFPIQDNRTTLSIRPIRRHSRNR